MFGDFGHGMIMALAGFILIYYEKYIYSLKVKNEVGYPTNPKKHHFFLDSRQFVESQ
jgi:vacuolar-type H+-ATPase subunit I/STV1